MKIDAVKVKYKSSSTSMLKTMDSLTRTALYRLHQKINDHYGISKISLKSYPH